MRHLTMPALVVGSGAAGMAAALRLAQQGVQVAVVTESLCAGTSRNTGSDKQTYYKLTLAGEGFDSVRAMARDLMAGGMHGDHALKEAALSSRAFATLLDLGVAFPHNPYGEYVGYRTDHDPRQRATSAGPLTSQDMAACLQRAVQRAGVPIYEGYQVIELLAQAGEVRGVMALDLASCAAGAPEIAVFLSPSVVWATGGPAGIYRNSVYPESQLGASGMVLAAGAAAENLAQWQYGIASVAPRWNLSGSYQQVLPRYLSVDDQGGEHDFLAEAFADPVEMAEMIFRKGYEWPFDSRKAEVGSSRIDLLVVAEEARGRQVYLDFTRTAGNLTWEQLPELARQYLDRSGATAATPIERLEQMNAPAAALYRSLGVDLARQRLRVSVAAQHHNGGIACDAHWQSPTLAGLYPVGEAAATHGAYRPGGAALNAGQVGALCAAEHIAQSGREPVALTDGLRAQIDACAQQCARFLEPGAPLDPNLVEDIGARMGRGCDLLRRLDALSAAYAGASAALKDLKERHGSADQLPLYWRGRDLLFTQQSVCLAMMADWQLAGSWGGAIKMDPEGAFTLGEGLFLTQRLQFGPEGYQIGYEMPRPLPEPDDWFEDVWRRAARR
ncbi:MAG: FAD-binding protein [Christensenellales bacterium]|jgi:succinate dehydrogenase / fumarate reductase flavoprotein subunit